MIEKDIINKITKLKEEKNAIVLAHYYQVKEVQEIADFLGDSLELSRKAAQIDCDTIVFCGVHFMAESAKILNPHKKVLLPVRDAGCPMADMITSCALNEAKEKYPDAAVVCYVNSSASVKAQSHICCTSSNAVEVVRSIPRKKILFVPDKNLASYVSSQMPQKEIIIWEGFCPTHANVFPEDVGMMREKHPYAEILVHPECPPQVVRMADFAGSTSGILKRAKESSSEELIIGTEMGLLYKLQEENPHKKFYLLSKGLICPNMKRTGLEDVLRALEKEEYAVEVDEEIRQEAVHSLDKMLAVV